MTLYGTIKGAAHSPVLDPWNDQDPADNPPSPCRTIAITPEILAEDAAKQAALIVPVSAWPIKASLSEANLHGMRKRESVEKKPRHPRTTAPKPKRATTPRTPTAPRKEMPPMSQVEYCSGGCGKKLTAKQIKNGIKTAWGHSTGCDSVKTSTAPKGAKSSPPPQIGLAHTLDFAKKTLAAVQANIAALEKRAEDIGVELLREDAHIKVLTGLIADLEQSVPEQQENGLAEALAEGEPVEA